MSLNLDAALAFSLIQLEPIPTAPADWQVTCKQIGLGALMNLGARHVIHDNKEGMASFTIGRGGKFGRRAYIRLQVNDLYRIDIARLKRGTAETVVDATADDIHCEQLAETLLRLHHEVTCG